MKKLLILLLLLSQVVSAQTYAPQLSLNPNDSNFCIFFNNVLNITSYYVAEKDVHKVFAPEDKVDQTVDNIWFALHRTYYKLWLPDESLLFVVRLPAHRDEILGDHLVFFINTLRLYHENKANTR